MGRRGDDSDEFEKPLKKRPRSRYEDDEDDDEEDEDDEEEEEEYARERFRCKGCGSKRSPVLRSKVSATGWVVFWVCIWAFPFNCLAFLMRDSYRQCSECTLRVGRKP